MRENRLNSPKPENPVILAVVTAGMIVMFLAVVGVVLTGAYWAVSSMLGGC